MRFQSIGMRNAWSLLLPVLVLHPATAQQYRGLITGTVTGDSVLDGVWERSYTQTIFPYLSISEDRPKPDTIIHLVVLRLARHTYELEWMTRDQRRRTQTKKQRGRIRVNADTLAFLDDEAGKLYQFHVYSDTLSLGQFHRPNEPRAYPISQPHSATLILDGMYRRREPEK